MSDSPPLNAFLFAALGIAVFLAACTLAAKIAPFDVRQQIIEKGNIAAAIVAAAAILALGWIIAAVMH